MHSKTLRVVSWNCNGAFRQKLELMEPLNADLLVIQEAEDPDKWGGSYREWASSFLWRGTNRNKGLAIFARDGLKLSKLDWPDHGRELFLPCRVDNKFNLLGVWTKQNKAIGHPYIGQFWAYLNSNRQNVAESPFAAVGDFNSNSRWDRQNRNWNHGDVVRELQELEIQSLYHLENEAKHGYEADQTLYLLRDLKRPFHIDYAFAHKSLISNKIAFTVGKPEMWLKHSDHMPIVFNLATPS
jgi:exonuclease III